MSAAVENPDVTTSIPTVTSRLIGRDRELRELECLFADPTCRLVTLTGAGGVGKTRLATQIATNAVQQRDERVAFVRLAAIRDPGLVLPAIGLVFGFTNDPQGNYEAFLLERLADERALVVLDNLEQVRSAAPAIRHLLEMCPGIRILATSQAVLGIAGERCYALPPLDVPQRGDLAPESFAASGAVALFLDRAQAANPALDRSAASLRTIATICQQLDGLPLAIELAAARMRILSPDSLLPRLGNRLGVLGGGEQQDLPERMHTMRKTVAWSYDLLSTAARRLMRHLAVFPAGFSLDAVEFVVDTWGGDDDALDLLSELVDHSLVRSVVSSPDKPRYEMLALIRDFGVEQLRDSGEIDTAMLAQVRFVAGLASEAGEHLTGSDQSRWLAMLDTEIENIRAAVQWALSHEQESFVLRIGGSIWRYLSTRNLFTEGRMWLDSALHARSAGDTLDRVRALLGAAFLAEDQRDLDVSHELFTQARQLAAAIGAQKEEHRALIGLGTVAHDRGEYDIASEYHARATAMARDIPYERGVAVGLANLATVAYFRGDLHQASAYWEEGQLILAKVGDTVGLAIGACNLGAVNLELERYDIAERYLQQALTHQRELNSVRDLPFTLINLGEVARHLEDYTLAHDSLAEAIALLRKADDEATIGIAMQSMGELALAQGHEDECAQYLLESIRILASFDDLHSLLECLHLAADMASRRGRHEWVVELIAADTVLREQIESPRTALMNRYVESFVARARTALDPATIQRCERDGASLTLETVPRRLTTIVREIIGRQQHSPVLPTPAPAVIDHSLTARELEVLQLLTQGNSTNEIAELLFVSPRTVATHVTNILGKLNVSSRTAAVAWALRSGVA